MKRLLPVLACLALLFYCSTEGWSAEVEPDEISYSGYSPNSFADVYKGNWKVGHKELTGKLHLPDGEGPFPAVVIQHGSGHPKHLEPWLDIVIPALLNARIAAFVANSFDGRNITGTGGDQAQLSKAARVVDALMALKALAEHSKIDGDKIGITGYSFGGVVSYETADRRTVESVLGSDLKFAAHLPAYPTCGAHREKIDMTGSPILFLLGRQDDYTPAKFCEEYLPKLQAAGVPATMKVYEEAGHAFILVIDQYMENNVHFNDCGIGIITEEGYHELGNITEKGMTWPELLMTLFKKCGSRGVSHYGTRESQRQALDDTVNFSKVRCFSKYYQTFHGRKTNR